MNPMTEKTPAQLHFERMTAKASAQADPYGERTSDTARLMLASLATHKNTLKQIQARAEKIAYKRDKALPDITPYVDGVMQADTGGKDEVVSTAMVWLMDVGDYDQCLACFDYTMRHDLGLPDQFNRDPVTWLADEMAEHALSGRMYEQHAPDAVMTWLATVEATIDGHDCQDPAKANLYKAMAYNLCGRHRPQDQDIAKDMGTDQIEAATKWLEIALTLNPKVGVKKDIERLQARRKAASKAQD